MTIERTLDGTAEGAVACPVVMREVYFGAIANEPSRALLHIWA